MMRPQLPPYQRRDETLLERCARLRAELRAVGEGVRVERTAANENQRPMPRFWWSD